MSHHLLKNRIARVPDFPKKGVLFYDLTPIFSDAMLFPDLILKMQKLADERDFQFDKIAAIEARGFILGAALALVFEVGFVAIRKYGKLPRITHKMQHDLEYGQQCHEVHQSDINPGERILIVDDILATGGTAHAAGELIRSCQAHVAGYLFAAKITGLQKERIGVDESVACLMDLP